MTHRLARAAPAVLIGLLIALPAAPLPLRAAVPDDAWSDAFRFPGPPADVLALGEHDGELVAGDHLWTGSEWRRLGAGLDGPVHALASHEGDLYAAGDFRGSGPVALSRVARWDGAAWRPVGEGLPEVCRALTVYAGRLHAGARMWNGAAWSDVLQTDGAVLGLAVHEGVLVAVGEFAEAGGAPAGGVVGWDGADLVPMPALPAGCPEALAVHDGRLVAAGRFTIPEHGEGAAVLALDGASWEVLRFDAGVDTVRQPFYTALASRDGALFVGGAEYSGWEGGYIGVRLKLLRGEGEAWSDVGWSGRGEILALLSRPAGLVAGGSFLGVSDAGGRHFAPRAARLAPGGLEPLLQTGEGLEDEVTHLVSWDEVLVAGGSFAAAGANFAAAYAGWTAAGWQAMDAWPILGPPDSPRAGSLAIHGGALFTTALCGTVDGCGEYYGRWYPGIWICADGPGAEGTRALLSTPDGLVRVRDDSILRGDGGGAWSPLASTVEGGIARAAALVAGELHVGGGFTALDGVTAGGVARLDGSGWQALGAGVQGDVHALTAYDGRLAVGGELTAAGGSPVAGVALWDGAGWSALGEGIEGRVNALAADGDRLFAAGAFAAAGGEPAANVACWDGEHWEPLGSGTDGEVLCLALHAGRLYLGGRFTAAGGGPSHHLAAWSLQVVEVHEPEVPASEPLPDRPALENGWPNPFNPSTTFAFVLPGPGRVRLTVHDARGRLVARLVAATLPAGHHRKSWDGRDLAGAPCASGIYLVRLETRGGVATRKMLLAR